MLDTVYNTFDVRVLREHRRVTVDEERASESEEFHAVLTDVALGETTERVKNFGVWFRYDSRTGTHNAYKEFREMSAEKAINHLYQNMAGLSRAKASAIQILKVSELAPSECKRPDIKQFHKGGIQFPLPHRVRKTEKAYKTTFKASRPNTHY